MSGLVLLDESLERELASAEPHRHQQQQYQASGRYQRGQGIVLLSQHEPRTDFTTRAFSPTTDFTSARASSRSNFISNEGLPRTDFTTRRSSDGKPSVGTYNSSPRTILRGHNGSDGVDPLTGRDDSYPILRSDDSDSVTDESGPGHGSNKHADTKPGLKISVRYIVLGLVIGIVLGILLSHLGVSKLAARWISLPGELFLRAVKCLVVPYILCSVAVAIGDIVFVGKVSVVGFQTAKVFEIFWLTSVTMGVSLALLFRPLFHQDATPRETNAATLGLTCFNNMTVTLLPNSSIACTDESPASAPAAFSVLDVNNVLTRRSEPGIAELSLSNQLMTTMLPIISDNITKSMANSELLSIITFVVFPLIVFLMTRCNPYNHMRGMVRAYMFALASSSSLATAPVTLTCVRRWLTYDNVDGAVEGEAPFVVDVAPHRLETILVVV